MSDKYVRVLASKTLAFTGTSASTTLPGVGHWTQFRLCASQDCYIVTGEGAATATNAGTMIPAGVEIFIQIPDTHSHIAAIQDAANGNLNIAAVG